MKNTTTTFQATTYGQVMIASNMVRYAEKSISIMPSNKQGVIATITFRSDKDRAVFDKKNIK